MLAGACVLAACSAPARSGAVVGRVTDSAGVRAVRFDSLPAADGPLAIARRPWLVLGGLHDDDSLEFDLRGVHLTAAQQASGEIVVGDHQRLTYFDTAGRLLRIAGRAGYGPGEFSSIRDLCPQDDSTLLVVDGDGRWSLWSRAGEPIRTNARVGNVPLRACDAQGHVLAQVSEPGEPLPRADRRRLVSTWLFGLDGAPPVPLGKLNAAEYYGQLFFEPGYALTAGTVLLGDPRTFEIREIDRSSGAVVRTWQVRGGVRAVAQREFDSLIETTVPPDATPEARARVLSRYARLGNPGVMPGFHRMLRDPDGRLWFSVYFATDEWLVIDSAGARLSRLRLPLEPAARPDLVGFTRGGVIVRHVDEDGALRLGIHRLVDG